MLTVLCLLRTTYMCFERIMNCVSSVDNYYLSANAAARWYFNPQIPQARHLYGGYFPL